MTDNLTWCLSPNVGDACGPWLFQAITGRRPIYAAPGAGYPHNVSVGSILNWANAESTVWGAGLASWKDDVVPCGDVRAVRGPLSALRARWCGVNLPEVYGDPALLLPRYIKPDVKKTYRLGVFPHYVDLFRAHEWYKGRDGVLVIDPLRPVEEVVVAVASCERILSSALHGLVIADAYGVPNTLAKMGDSIGGDGAKYVDYLASVGRADYHHPPTFVDYRTTPPGENDALEFTVANPEIVTKLQEDLLGVCPYGP